MKLPKENDGFKSLMSPNEKVDVALAMTPMIENPKDKFSKRYHSVESKVIKKANFRVILTENSRRSRILQFGEFDIISLNDRLSVAFDSQHLSLKLLSFFGFVVHILRSDLVKQRKVCVWQWTN